MRIHKANPHASLRMTARWGRRGNTRLCHVVIPFRSNSPPHVEIPTCLTSKSPPHVEIPPPRLRREKWGTRLGQALSLQKTETQGSAPAFTTSLRCCTGEPSGLTSFRFRCRLRFACMAFQFDQNQVQCIVASVLRQISDGVFVLRVACFGGKVLLFPVRKSELALRVV